MKQFNSDPAQSLDGLAAEQSVRIGNESKAIRLVRHAQILEHSSYAMHLNFKCLEFQLLQARQKPWWDPRGESGFEPELETACARSCLRRDKLHTNILLAVARPVNRNYAALHGLRGMVVYKHERVAHQHDLFQRNSAPCRFTDCEFVCALNFSPLSLFPMYCQGNRQRLPEASAAVLCTENVVKTFRPGPQI